MWKLVALAGVGGAYASETAVTPTEKVIDLLEGLQTKVIEEGKSEAKTYDKFACFCKDTFAAKTTAIEENVTASDDAQARMDTAATDRSTEDGNISDEEKALRDLATAKAVAEKNFASTKATYATNIQDVEAAVDSLERAVDTLKQSNQEEQATGATASLLEVKQTVVSAVRLADALGLGNAKSAALLQAAVPLGGDDGLGEGVAVSDYDFHSGGIVETLEDLHKKFTATRDEVNKTFNQDRQDHHMDMDENHNDTESAKKRLGDARAAREDARARFAQGQKDYTIAEADLQEDRAYLKDMNAQCNAKKTVWDARHDTRELELNAIGEAITQLHDSTLEIQARANQRAHAVAHTEHEVKAVQKSVKKISSSPSFIQLAAEQRGFLQARSPRDRVLALFGSQSKVLKSAVLASMATAVRKDPLAKVKKLIEELVLRLQNEASKEQTHNAWCINSRKLASQKRDTQAAIATEQNTKLRGLEARRDKLDEQMKKLTKQLDTLKTEFDDAKAIYDDESQQRKDAERDAKEGLVSVQKAIDILNKFYKDTATKDVAEHEERETTSADNMPDAGFAEADGRDNDTAGGIMGMLDVIVGDFERTRDQSAAAQREAELAFTEYEGDYQTAKSQKETTKADRDSQHTQALTDITTANEALKAALREVLSGSIELQDLHAACEGGGQTYEERVAKRKEEIEALKQGFEILDNYSN